MERRGEEQEQSRRADTLVHLQRRLLHASQYDHEERQRGELQRCLETLVQRQLEVCELRDATSASDNVFEHGLQEMGSALECELKRLAHLSMNGKAALCVHVIEQRLLPWRDGAQVQSDVLHTQCGEPRPRQPPLVTVHLPSAGCAAHLLRQPAISCRVLWPLYCRCRVAVALMATLEAHSTEPAAARSTVEGAVQDVMGAMLLTLLRCDPRVIDSSYSSSELPELASTSSSAMRARLDVQHIVWWLLTVQSFCVHCSTRHEDGSDDDNLHTPPRLFCHKRADTVQRHACDGPTQTESRWHWLLQTGRLCLYATLQRDLVRDRAAALTTHMRDLLYATTSASCAAAQRGADALLDDMLAWCNAELAIPECVLSMTTPAPHSSHKCAANGAGDATLAGPVYTTNQSVMDEQQTAGRATSPDQTLGAVVLHRVLHHALRSLAQLALEQADALLTEAYALPDDGLPEQDGDAAGWGEMGRCANESMRGRLRTILRLLESKVDGNVLGAEHSYLTLKRLSS